MINSMLRRGLVLAALLLTGGLLAVALLRPASLAAEELRGPVVAISDGDTLTVLVDQRPLKVRLWGIDAPEKAQAFGARSKASLAEMAFGKQARVEVRDTDRYGRAVSWVTVDGQAVNLRLVSQGLAWWYTRYAPKDSQLREAEQAARAQRLGLWADENPQPPWEFRKEKRSR